MGLIVTIDAEDLCTLLDEVFGDEFGVQTQKKISRLIYENQDLQIDVEVRPGEALDYAIENGDSDVDASCHEFSDGTYWDRQSTEDQIELTAATFESLTPEILKATYNPNSPYEVELLKRELDDAGYKF